MLRRVIYAGCSTCAFALKSVFRRPARRLIIRALGLLVALGCAVVFDGGMRASAQGGGGGGVVGGGPGRVEELFADRKYCWRIEKIVFETKSGEPEWRPDPEAPNRPTSGDHNFDFLSFEGATIAGGGGQIIISDRSGYNRAVRYPCPRPPSAKRKVDTESDKFDSDLFYRLRRGERRAPEEERAEIGSTDRRWTGPHFGDSFGRAFVPYIEINAAGSSTCFNQTNPFVFTVVAPPDVTDLSRRTTCTGQFFGGMTFGMPVATGDINGDGKADIIFGVEATAMGGTGSTTLQGTPTLAVNGTTDTYDGTNNFLGTFNAVVTAPIRFISPNLAVTLSGGVATVHTIYTYGCNSLCNEAGTGPFTQTQSFWRAAPDVGVGLLFTPSGSPVAFSLGFTHIFVPKADIEFTNPGAVPVIVKANVGQDINLVKFGIRATIDQWITPTGGSAPR